MAWFRWLILLIVYSSGIEAVEDFPSLISANASIAVVLDREFMGENYAPTLETIKDYIKELTREQLKHGGVNVHYYSWSSVTIKSELSAVLSVASCEDTWKLHATARAERVALMAITEADCPRLPKGGSILVPIISPGQELPQLSLDMRASKAFDWKSAVVLHDDTLSRDMISRVVTALTMEVDDKSVSSVAISVFKMKHEESDIAKREEIDKTLSQLKPSYNGENYCVIVTTDVMISMMEVAKSRNMVHPKAQWMYFISDTDGSNDNVSSLTSMMGEGENIAIVYNVTNDLPSCQVIAVRVRPRLSKLHTGRPSVQPAPRTDTDHHIFINDLYTNHIFQSGLICHCKELIKAFILALDRAIVEEMEVAVQVSDEEWEAIRPTKQERGLSLIAQIENHLSINSVCNNCTRWRLKSGDTWGTSYVRSKSNSTRTEIELTKVGSWRPVDGLRLKDRMFLHIAHGFRGRSLPIAVYHNPPWSILIANETGFVVEHKGLVFDIVNELAHNLNFSYYTINPTIIKDEFSNDTLEGHFEFEFDSKKASQEEVFEIIQKKGVFLVATAFTITQDKESRINFTMPISTQSYAFLVSRPRELSRALLFMAPFASDTWLCLGFSLMMMGPALYAVHKLSPFYEIKTRKKRGGLATLHHCLWYMYGALLQQGGMYLPDADSGRLVVGTWWLVVLVVVTTYCGNLVAFLTFPRQEAPITTVRELLQHSATITWSLRKNTFLEECLKESDLQKYKDLYQGAILNNGETPESIRKTREGKHAIFDWKINLKFIMKKEFLETDRCDYALSIEEFMEEQMGMILNKNSPYLPMINEEIKRMHQMGLIQKWLTQYLPKKDRCWNVGRVAEVNNHTVNLDDMQGCFFVLFLGFFSATLIIFIEWLCKRRRIKVENKAVKPFTN